jgi:hypothetical protein
MLQVSNGLFLMLFNYHLFPAIYIKMWSQLQQPFNLNGTDLSHIFFGRDHYLIVEYPFWFDIAKDTGRVDDQSFIELTPWVLVGSIDLSLSDVGKESSYKRF